MLSTTESQLAFWGLLLLAGVFSNKLSSRFNMPILLMFLGVGMAVGSDGFGFINWSEADNAEGINALGMVAMSFILFSGGLSTRFRSIRPVLGRGLLLATGGVALTALFLGICIFGVYYFLSEHHHSFQWCLLLASLISSTDAAAMFAILRGKGVSLQGDLQPLLELESGSNDPMAALLTLFLIGLLNGGEGAFNVWSIPFLFYKLAAAVVVGLAVGVVGQKLFNITLEYEGLYYVLGVSLVLICFGGAEAIRANGFLAVYVCGLTMGNVKCNYRTGLSRFSEGIAWLMQVLMFTSLGILVNPKELLLPHVLSPGIALAVSLMVIARPGAVFLCLWGSSYNWRERLLISWAGLRGAAPIVLATFPLVNNIDNSSLMFNMVFFLVIGSVLVQGMTLMPLARKLKLDKPFSDRGRAPLEFETLSGSGNQDLQEFTVPASSHLAGLTLANAKLPVGILVVMIRRGKTFVQPRGDTEIMADDGLLVMGTPQKLLELVQNFFPDSDYQPEKDIDDLKREFRFAGKTVK